MTALQACALAVALVCPAVVALALGGSRGRSRSALPPFRWAQVAAVVSAGGWLALVVNGERSHAGGFYVSPLVAAGGCGTALLTVAVVEGMTPRRSVAAACAALAAVGVGLTAGGDASQVAAVVGGLGLAALLAIGGATGSGPAGTAPSSGPAGTAPSSGPAGTAPGSGRVIAALLAAGGVVACGVGFVTVHARSGRWIVPTASTLSVGAIVAFLACAALLAACGTLGLQPAHRSRPEPGALLLAAGLAVGLSAAPLRAGGAELGVAVVILATAAVLAAGVRRGALSLALLALAAAAGPAALVPGSRLLAAAAVIAAAVDAPWGWLVVVPGAVSLATGVVDDGGRLAFAAAVGTAAVTVLLAHAAIEEAASRRDVGPSGPLSGVLALGALPAAIAGAWLIVAPGTWTWTGAALDAYDQGMARAVAAGLLVVVARVLVGELRRRPGSGSPPRRRSRQRRPRPAPPGRHGRPPAQLVTSGRSASTPRPRRATRSQRARPLGRVPARPPTGTRAQRRRRPRPPEA